jgi:cation diffusion facilitator family transporter
MSEETKGTVLVALFANLGVGVVKLAGGLVSGSTALMAEAAHSVADTLNELFLVLSLSKADKPADPTHPFGYGMERFFWSLIAAVGIFVTGAAYSVYEGVTSILGEAEETSTRSFVVIYVVLAISLLLEGYSLSKALRQVRGEAREARRKVLTYIRRSPDPTVKTVASEDTIAVLGVLVALVGTVLHQVTGDHVWDGAASIVIGLCLAYVAYVLGRDTKELLIGEAADPAARLIAYDAIDAREEVTAVKEMLTMQLGPDSVLVAARVDFVDTLTAGDLERVCTEIEDEMRRRMPSLTQVFLDPSSSTGADAERVAGRLRQTEAQIREYDGEDGLERVKALRGRAGQRLRSG